MGIVIVHIYLLFGLSKLTHLFYYSEHHRWDNASSIIDCYTRRHGNDYSAMNGERGRNGATDSRGTVVPFVVQ